MKKLLLGLTFTCALSAIAPPAKAQVAFTNFTTSSGCTSGTPVPPRYYIFWACEVVGTVFTGFTSPNNYVEAYIALQGYCTIPFTIYGGWTGKPSEEEADVYAYILPTYIPHNWQTCFPTSYAGTNPCVTSAQSWPC